jgi:hypothetical protein
VGCTQSPEPECGHHECRRLGQKGSYPVAAGDTKCLQNSGKTARQLKQTGISVGFFPTDSVLVDQPGTVPGMTIAKQIGDHYRRSVVGFLPFLYPFLKRIIVLR